MELRKLGRIGLTNGEVKVYSALVKGGALTKTRLADRADVSSSKVYEIAGKLVKKGLVSSYIRNNVQFFSVTNPSFLMKYVEEKEKELAEEKKIVEELMPGIERMKSEVQEDTGFELYEGWEGMMNVLNRTFEKLPRGSTIYGLGLEMKQLSMLHKYHRLRVSRDIRQKMIFPDRDMETTKYKGNERRYIPGITDVGLAIVGETVIINTTEPDPATLMIRHPKIANSFRNMHSALWKIAKK